MSRLGLSYVGLPYGLHILPRDGQFFVLLGSGEDDAAAKTTVSGSSLEVVAAAIDSLFSDEYRYAKGIIATRNFLRVYDEEIQRRDRELAAAMMALQDARRKVRHAREAERDARARYEALTA